MAVCKQAHMAAVQAEAHAQQAALSIKEANLVLDRMEKLCERDLDVETVQTIKDLIKGLKPAHRP